MRRLLVIFLALGSVLPACDSKSSVQDGAAEPDVKALRDWKGSPEPAKPGIAVAVVVDTSGSMKEKAKGAGSLSRSQAVERALVSIVSQCEKWTAAHPGTPLEVGLYSFSGSIKALVPMRPFAAPELRSAIESLRKPEGTTAIGRAMARAGIDLLASGREQRHLFVLTDGENKEGTAPSKVATLLEGKSGGLLKFHFIAFETDAQQFTFVRERGGSLLSATGADLGSVVGTVFTQILAEAPEEAR
jgi:Mg-chelatase subunit ChlD